MSRDRVIRAALWTSVALNLLGVAVFLPAALGSASARMPIPVPRFYAAQIGLTIALFAGVYAWLARQPRIDRPLVVVGALGKLGFFALFVAYWLAGDLPGAVVPQALPDLLLASVFLWWAHAARKESTSMVQTATA
jgi:hypothetical protein